MYFLKLFSFTSLILSWGEFKFKRKKNVIVTFLIFEDL